jgi:hypothetical protein
MINERKKVLAKMWIVQIKALDEIVEKNRWSDSIDTINDELRDIKKRYKELVSQGRMSKSESDLGTDLFIGHHYQRQSLRYSMKSLKVPQETAPVYDDRQLI